MKNTRTISVPPNRINFSDLDFDEWELKIDHRRLTDMESGYFYSGQIKIKDKQEIEKGQIHYKITANRSILFISFVKVTPIISLRMQKDIVNRLIAYHQTEMVSFAYKNLAEMVANDNKAELKLTKDKKHWGFVLPR